MTGTIARFWIYVAPREGAWIETAAILRFSLMTMVAPREGAWIETSECIRQVEQICRAPRGRVD